MDVSVTVIIAFAILINAVLVWFLTRQKASPESDLALLNQFNDLRRVVDEKMGETTKVVHESISTQHEKSLSMVRDVTERLARLDETNKQVVSFADQLQSLQDILQNTKQRGALGEYYLEKVLQDVFAPSQYALQYQFKNGEAVDAALFLQDKKILPIDSKFSLENYRRILESREPEEKNRLQKAFINDLKLRIKETSKYIRPEENTMDFAFMFIPSEAIYYDLLANRVGVVDDEDSNILQRAYKEYKVIIVSPTTFVAYLQTVLQGLRSLHIEEQAKEIQKRVGELGRHITTTHESMQKLGNSLGTVVGHFNTTHNELKKIDKDVLKISGIGGDVQPLTLERPQQEE